MDLKHGHSNKICEDVKDPCAPQIHLRFLLNLVLKALSLNLYNKDSKFLNLIGGIHLLWQKFLIIVEPLELAKLNDLPIIQQLWNVSGDANLGALFLDNIY